MTVDAAQRWRGRSLEREPVSYVKAESAGSVGLGTSW